MASKLVFTTATQTLTAGVLSATITVQEQDQYNNPTTTAETVNLSTSASGTGVFENTAGNSTITSVSIPAGQNSASFTYLDTHAGIPTITASAAGSILTSATQQETVNPNLASKLVFTTATQTLTVGVLSATITVQEQDQYNNPTTTAETVNLSTSASGTGVFKNTAGNSTITSVSIPAGQNSVSFTYLDTHAGTPTITASDAGGILTSATQQETVNPTLASKLVFTTVAQTLTAGVLSTTITVQEQDQYNNPTTTAETVNLSTSASGTGVFKNLAGSSTITSVSIPAGQNSATFTYLDTHAGTPTITASDAGGVLTSAMQQETVNQPLASKLVFTTVAQMLTAGVLSATITVQEQDQYNNPTTMPETVNLSTSASGTGVFKNLAGNSTITSVSIPAGQNSASFTYLDTHAGTPTITASDVGGVLTSATQQETVNQPLASKLVFTTVAQTLTAGVLSATITVQEQDQYNNPTTTAETVNLSTSASGTGVFKNTAGSSTITSVSIPAGQNSASFTYLDTQAGTPTITADDAGGVLTSATQRETVNAATSTLSGYVYVDPANDGNWTTQDMGLGGVTIILSLKHNGQYQQVQQTLSGIDGAYHFQTLAAGTYQVTETPPTAFIDGIDTVGTVGGSASGQMDKDRLSEIVLGAGQQGQDYNFRQRGLLPQYISARFFLASTPTNPEQIFRQLINAVPAISLDGAQAGDYSATFTNGGGAVSVVSTDAATVTHADGGNLASLTATITNPKNGTDEKLTADTTGTAIASSYSNNVLTLSGVASAADYQRVLRTIQYDNAAASLDTTTRTITFAAFDGTDWTNPAAVTYLTVMNATAEPSSQSAATTSAENSPSPSLNSPLAAAGQDGSGDSTTNGPLKNAKLVDQAFATQDNWLTDLPTA